MPVIESPGISTAPSFRIRLARETYTSLLLSDIYTDFARGGRSDLFCNKKRAFASFDRFRSTPEPRSNTCPAKSSLSLSLGSNITHLGFFEKELAHRRVIAVEETLSFITKRSL